ncbi:MAG: hypothetical protein JXR57_01825 [Bacteroidales bacterium]|nr:hypothetical protein [Bacteroidales bacterium]
MNKDYINKNIPSVIKFILQRFNIPYYTIALNHMKEHPDYPSFMSFQYALKKVGIDSIALKTNIEELRHNLPKPVVVHVTTNADLFFLIDSVTDTHVNIVSSKDNIEPMSISEFNKYWDNNALILDTENIKREKIALKEKIKDILLSVKWPFVLLCGLALTIICMAYNSLINSPASTVLLITSAIGIVLSALLVHQTLDSNNLFLHKLCSSKANKKMSCTSVLESKDAYFLGFISWSDIGLLYFLCLFIINLLYPEQSTQTVSIIFMLLAFPYTFYSIWYQRFVIRSWCRLCLGVQFVIAINFTLALCWYKQSIPISVDIFNLLKLFITICSLTIAYIIIKPLIKSHITLKQTNLQYKSIKHNNQVIGALLANMPQLDTNSAPALVNGNPQGENVLTLIISPVCQPCINELRILLPLLKAKENTQIRTIFFTDKKNYDPEGYKLAEILIDRYIAEPESFLETLLNYSNNYPASKYTTIKESINCPETKSRFQEQIKWCLANGIHNTPILIFNTTILQAYYTSQDIDYLCE